MTPTQTDHALVVPVQEEAALCTLLREAASQEEGIFDRVEALLDEIVRLSLIDPLLVQAPAARLEEMCREMAVEAVVAGQVGSADLEPTVAVLSAMTVGLVATAGIATVGQALAAEGFKRLLRGTLLRPGG